MRAVIYARVSSAQQKDKHTIESQLTVLPQWIEAQGWKLVAPARTYVDDGFSAGAGKHRAAYTRLLADAAKDLFDVVVVVALDRLTRSDDLRERGEFMGTFQRCRVQIAEAGTGSLHDLTSPMGGMFAFFKAVVASEERDRIRERTRRGHERAIRDGRKPRGKTPYGYQLHEGKPVILEAEAAVVREIYERVAGGETCRAIGRDLERRGVPSAQGGRWIMAIWRMVAFTGYRGRWVVDKNTGAAIDVPRLVDDVLWFAAQEAVSWYRIGRAGARSKHVYLCEKIARCGLCGGPVWVVRNSEQRKNGERWRAAYYVCRRRKDPDPDGSRCTLPMRRVERIDEELWRELAAFLATPGRAERLLLGRRRAAVAEADSWAGDAAQAKARIDRIEEAETAILARFSKGLISEAAMDAHVKATAMERAFLGEQMRAAAAATSVSRSAGAAAGDVLATLAELRAKLADADAATRREIVNALIPGREPLVVTVEADRVVARLAIPQVRAGRCGSASLSPQELADQRGSRIIVLSIAA